jgi:anti-anti-sigma regulatory factor
MSAVTFIGTVTIVALTQTRDALSRQSRSLTVRSPSKCVRRLLTVCGQADLIEPE